MNAQVINARLFDLTDDGKIVLPSLRAEVTCSQVWSLEQSATAVTRFRRPTRRRANATWSAKAKRATCAEEPTGYPSTGWS